MGRALSREQVIGIVLIALGVLVLFSKGLLVTVAAVALIVFGILVLIGKARGSTLVAVVCIVGGVVLLGDWLDPLKPILQVAALVVGVILILLGILKLLGK